MTETGRVHFLQQRCTYTIFRFPWITCTLCAVCIAVYYTRETFQMSYARDHCELIARGWSLRVPNDPNNIQNKYRTDAPDDCDNHKYWYTAATHSIAHNTERHLWQNILILVIAGTILELTESSARALLTVLIAGPTSAAGHGIVHDNPVRGVSGIVYGIIVYQIALVAKNFREMQFRDDGSFLVIYRSALSAASSRLVIGALLLISEIAVSVNSTNISHSGHAAGALAGALCGLAFGSNVIIEPLEIIIPFVGVLGLFGMILGVLASGQFYAALWMWFATLASLPLIYKEVVRWGLMWHLRFSSSPPSIFILRNR